MVKIAFSGKLCSGKSTAAKIIGEIINDVTILSFAGKVKEIARDLFGMTTKDRELLINIGKKMREIDSDIWIKYLLKESEKYENVVVDDLRFPNEYKYLKEHGFTIIRLNISREQQLERIKILYDDWEVHSSKNNDESEVALDSCNFDYCIDTPKSLDDLKQILVSIINVSDP